jgi:hypothetical protein
MWRWGGWVRWTFVGVISLPADHTMFGMSIFFVLRIASLSFCARALFFHEAVIPHCAS